MDRQLRVVKEGLFTLTTFINSKKELQARVTKAPTNQLVFSKKVASIEDAEDNLYKMIARQEQRIFLRKYIHKGMYSGHMSVFRENEPDTYTIFFFRTATRGLSRKHRESVVIPFQARDEMFSFFIKVFNQLVEVYGVQTLEDTSANRNSKKSGTGFSINEHFL